MVGNNRYRAGRVGEINAISESESDRNTIAVARSPDRLWTCLHTKESN